MTTNPVSKGEPCELDLSSMTVEEGLELIETERVRPLLKYLRTGVFENQTSLSYIKAYSVVVHFGDQQNHTEPLYKYYVTTVETYCKEVAAPLHEHQGMQLLKEVANVWEKATILIFWMQRVFLYLDRFFTKNNQEHPDLCTKALRIFKSEIYDVIKEPVIHSFLECIKSERSGDDIDNNILNKVTEMLTTVGDASPVVRKERSAYGDKLWWETKGTGVYKEDFEVRLLTETSEYYRGQVAGMLQWTCPEYLQEVERRLQAENARIEKYLHRSSTEPLLKTMQKELILDTAQRVVEMSTGLKAMLQQKRDSEMSLMYSLFSREHDTIPYMTGELEPYIEHRTTAIVEDQAKIEDSSAYIESLLALKQELDEMVSTCFKNDAAFQRSRNRGLENVLNKNTRCAKYLAVYCDLQMKKELKGKSEEETNSFITKTIGLFAHLKDKDVFLDFYKQALSKRLLNKTSISNDAEDQMISKLKIECGQQSVQKLASMFTDMSLSDQLQEEYKKCSHGGQPGGIDHDVRVLQTNSWPDQVEDAKITPSLEMVTCMDAFAAFYNNRHTGRKLRWMFNMGQIDMNTHIFQKKHILSVSTYQGMLLMIFNKGSQFSFGELQKETGIPEAECKRQLLSLTVSRNKVLSKDSSGKTVESGTMFLVNPSMTHEKLKIVIGMIKKDDKSPAEQAPPEPPVERKHVVDAAIVRVMKARKQLDHNTLLEEVFKQCTLFKPQPQQIKLQIENLIEREFLNRDPAQRNVYHYLP
jgi:cullin 3